MPARKSQPTREDILEATRRLAKRLGERLTFHDIQEATGFQMRLIHRHFGSWAALRKAAGLKRLRAPVEKVTSDAELISEYRRVAIEL